MLKVQTVSSEAGVRRSAGIWLATLGVAALMTWPGAAQAQMPAVCQQIQSQLARLDSAPSGGGNRRFAALAGRQRGEIANAQRQYQAAGCGGFFQSGQCAALSQHIGRMQANLAQLDAQGGGGGGGNGPQRARLMAAFDANGCRGGVRQAAAPSRGGFFSDETPERQIYRRAQTPDADRPQAAYQAPGQGGFGGFIEQLFGGGRREPARQDPAMIETPPSDRPLAPLGEDGEQRPRGVGYRAVCVRLCDGAFFPMTSSPRPGSGLDDEEMCQVQCPGTEVALFRMRDDRIENAVSSTGRSYSSLPNALRFRTRFDSACTCRPPNGSWAETFANRVDPTLRSGDQVVSAEQARLLSLPVAQRATVRDEIAAEQRARRDAERQTRTERSRGRDGSLPATIGLDGTVRAPSAPQPPDIRGTGPNAAPAAEPPAATETATDTERRPVRVIGPVLAPRAEAPRLPSGG
ncbi:DUF2865 domain-containing protein [Phreatobacter stygius]|uniref:DUF2865 domain-containing protein n=1 Tax=Phreatobacter stygius TaxID=1940610 RepID=A0A4D7BBT1_9HYPH|nr:DUF2865 domain-containing protein [Phreatobacter stygius]QCI67538.1 DUF2865 domain-containing protein [Phreatobacter stygius]